MLHGASYADELAYHDELAELAREHPRVTYRPTVSRPAESRNAGWTGDVGRVDALARVVADGIRPDGTHVYACGNSAMVETVRRDSAPPASGSRARPTTEPRPVGPRDGHGTGRARTLREIR